jgi:hypothetical protein
MHCMFQVGNEPGELLRGVIKTPYGFDEDELAEMTEEERAHSDFFSDDAVLQRDPGDLEVQINDEATPVADSRPVPAGQR